MKKVFLVFIFFTFVLIYVFGQSQETENKRLKYPNHPADCCHNIIGKSMSGNNSNNSNSSIGVSYQGIPGISASGVLIKGTAPPSPNTFFEFGLGVGYDNLSFNPYVNFCFFLPFNISSASGSLYAGGGAAFLACFDINNEFANDLSYFAGNILVGLYLWDWLNISFTYQIGGNLEGELFFDKYIYSVGYVYKF